MKHRFLTLTLLTLALIFQPAPAQQASPSPAKEFVHGRWFDGQRFRERTFYAVGGKLTTKRPPGKLETIDLQNGYVVPPFGDAHNHFPDSAKTLSWTNPLFLASGVFYILNPNDIGELANPIRGELGSSSTVDVIFAHGGFTCPGGHPQPLYEWLVDQKIYSYTKPELEGRAYYAIDSAADIEKKWPEFLATKPDFVKLYLVYSEAYGLPDAKHKSSGLRPELVPELTKRAHAAGLRTGAHIESASDFHAAVVGGVDFIMHLPGYHWREGDTEKDYLIDDADIRLAAKKKITVETTINVASRETNKEKLARIRQVEAENLRRLKAAGVKLVIATDEPPGNIVAEADDLQATGVFTNLELLRMLSVTTPQAIFPQRRIGRLDDGYEASFLVLAADPLEDLSALKNITLRIKDGEVYTPPPKQ